jgi:4-hydroxy-2-oxoglutarate aldolase
LNLYRFGKHEDVRDLQLRMIAPNGAVTARFGVPGLKAAMEMVGMYGGPPRSPLLPLTDVQKETLRSILVEAKIL